MENTTHPLSAAARPLIQASVPVLREYGLAITRCFYARLFAQNPELQNLFNSGNQANGAQQGSLATAVLAYAANIDDPAALRPVIDRIAHKHASVGIQPSQYPLVGRTLLAAIAEVLGSAATPELLRAWEEAYGLLADELIAAEERLYRGAGATPGELRQLVVGDVQPETAEVTSFYLETERGTSPGDFLPGQYVSVATVLSQSGLRQLRQYSLSDAPARPYWRITVKRDSGGERAPAGLVSNHLHANLRRGDRVAVSAPFGNFSPMPKDGRPLALLSAGVGVTPMISALNALVDARHAAPVLFLHAARSPNHQSLRLDIGRARVRLPRLTILSFFEDMAGAVSPDVRLGRMHVTPDLVAPFLDADFYLCGPLPFMRSQWRALRDLGVPPERIHREVFGPDLFDQLA